MGKFLRIDKKNISGEQRTERGSLMGTADQGGASAQKAQGGYQDKPWIPRFWDGITFLPWIALLVKNHFAVTPRRIGMAIIIVILSLVNTLLWLLQTIIYGRRIANTKLPEDPIFVIGHWRSGTTMLHEMFVKDSRNTFPDTYACFSPNHFLVSAGIFKPVLKFLLPAKRPMDNMAAGWDHPQEDEFALCNMGLPSPYLTAVFPNREPQAPEYLDMEGVSPDAVRRWQNGLLYFLQCLTVRCAKRIVLKSPPHTARVKTLKALFPHAKFVHIVRDPFVIFPSTINLWKRLYRDQGLQLPRFEGLDEYVFRTFERMYEAYFRDEALLDENQLCEVRYEDLVADPVGQMRRIYERLQLGEFESVEPSLAEYVREQKDYKTNRYQITPELQAEISRRWRIYAERYGYAKSEKTAAVR